MKRLALIRHSDATRDNLALKDFDRPLSVTGKNEAKNVAMIFANGGELRPRLVSSPALRALSTAQIFAAAFGVAPTAITQEAAIYDATAGTLLHVINQLGEDDRPVFLFGHNPGISEFARVLGVTPFYELPTCGAIEFELDAPSWAEVVPGCGTVRRYEHP